MQSLVNCVVLEKVFDNIVSSSYVWCKFKLLKVDEALCLDKLEILRCVEVLLVWSFSEVKLIVWSIVLVIIILWDFVSEVSLLI